MAATLRIACAGVALIIASCSPQPRVVLYCAQDRDFAAQLVGEFALQTSIDIAPKYDTEANKSVALYEEIVREASRPRCDVHWNNEIIATIRLQKQGLLQPYTSPMARDYPPESRSKDGTWQAFAARARVLIVNRQAVPPGARPTSMFDMVAPRWRGQIAMAKPQFGTTASHAACLFAVLGKETASRYYQDLQRNEVQLVAGNKQVAELVGQGRYAFGWTDSDDAMLEVKAGRPVTIVFPDASGHPHFARLGTLFLPNTVALIRDAPHPEEGRKLIDFLLRHDTEKRLAEGGGYQIPLNPRTPATLPAELAPALEAKKMNVDFEQAAEQWGEVQEFLRQQFAR